MIVTKFDIGDTVRCGPNEGKIVRICLGGCVSYVVCYWKDDMAVEYSAYDWELTLVEHSLQAGD